MLHSFSGHPTLVVKHKSKGLNASFMVSVIHFTAVDGQDNALPLCCLPVKGATFVM